MRAAAKAHTNIALIKYWGKRNESLILPTNNSLSVTLDGLYTKTDVDFDPALTEDTFYLNEEPIKGEAYNRVTQYLDKLRSIEEYSELYATITSSNTVSTVSGFASSASGFAALAAAAQKALGLNLNNQELCKITRQGSGSACRSIYGGFVEWEKGTLEDGSDSYAVPVT